jgi:hypothetical protein
MHWFGISSVFWDVIVSVGALLFLIFVFWLIIWWCIHDETVYFHHEIPKTPKPDPEVKSKFAKIKKIMKGESNE